VAAAEVRSHESWLVTTVTRLPYFLGLIVRTLQARVPHLGRCTAGGWQGQARRIGCQLSYRDTEAALAAIKKPAAHWQINIMYGDRTLDELVADVNHALAVPIPQD
jgi:hypothetical protein